MKTRGILVATSLALLLLAGCSSSGSTPEGVQTVSVTSACPQKVPAATPLAPVVAKGVPASATSCAYPFGDPSELGDVGPTATQRQPQLIYDALERAATAGLTANQCPQVIKAPTAFVLTYADSSTSTVVVDPGGCPSIVQDDDVADGSGGTSRRRVYLPSDSALL